jgi:hypothetical protein
MGGQACCQSEATGETVVVNSSDKNNVFLDSDLPEPDQQKEVIEEPEKKEEPVQEVVAEPDPVKVEPEGPPPDLGLNLEFDTGNGPMRVRLDSRPLGIWFKKEVPLQIEMVREEFAAGKACIEKGWTLKTINDVDVSSPEMEYAKARSVFDEHAAKLPMEDGPGKVVIVLTDSTNKDNPKDYSFNACYKPLGLEFTKSEVPITVIGATDKLKFSYGMLIGIKPGMSFKKIGDKDLVGLSYADSLLAMRDAIQGLPVLRDIEKEDGQGNLTGRLSSA